MSDRLSAKLRMYKRLLATLKRFNASWQQIPAFTKAVEQLTLEVDAINALNPELVQQSVGFTLTKEVVKQQMIEDALALSAALQAYAHATSSHELEVSSTVSLRDFSNRRETDADDLALFLHQLGTKHIAALGDFGYDQNALDSFARKIETFSEKIGQPKEIVTLSKEKRTKQQAHFDQADTAINKILDNLIVLFKTKDKDFYDAYQNARAVTRVGTRSDVEVAVENV